ncbi:N-formylglutamate amidohydrolase [Alkalimarinus alittae]|uniref:N-formylglutamate amidohydrolase n=1 Tax=Alkalimarinus alittae TaxID=2961619 RepID=A0ABY6N496_9ALTE|nr:N-formylglutamate amidohydrolase [Alkalimarinus alittae]UZE96812.1 N-formylglutamate amidohydrolase [Alkalimarinus alittae]
MILHIPHASTKIRDTDKFVEAVKDEAIEELTDWYTDQLFSYPHSERVIPQFSRVFCDVERFRNNEDEPMSIKGMGVVYTKGIDGKDLLKQPLSPVDEEIIKSSYYDKHHREFAIKLNRSLTLFPEVFIVDCHSFPATPLPYEDSSERPDFCLGTDDFHTPVEVVNDIKSYLEGLGFSVLINTPFGGTIVPLQHLHKNENVKSIMIEVNRKLYLVAPYTGVKSDDFEKVEAVITGILEIISEYEISKY